MDYDKFISSYLQDTASVKLTIENEMKDLPQATTCGQLMHIISDLKDLNADFFIMGAKYAKSDSDLIQILLSKMKAEKFMPLKFEHVKLELKHKDAIPQTDLKLIEYEKIIRHYIEIDPATKQQAYLSKTAISEQ